MEQEQHGAALNRNPIPKLPNLHSNQNESAA